VSVWYLDASALVKLIVVEPESGALRRYLGERPRIISSRIVEVELRRAVARQDEIDAGDRVSSLIATVELLELDGEVARRAGELTPATLRSLDAIHLASALVIAPEVDAVVAYDTRLAAAARAAGLAVVAPA
jgi:predicted nucleic acid-binding protein